MQRRKGNMRGGFKPPVEVGEELDVVIEAVGEKGDGIAKKNGFVLFVANTKEGETVRVRVTKVLQKVGFAEVIGKAESQPQVEERVEETVEEVVEEPQDQQYEDTEDFGDEPKEVEEVVEEKVEEKVEEEVVEEEPSEEEKKED